MPYMPTDPANNSSKSAPPGAIFGTLLLLAGLGGFLYFLFGFDDTVYAAAGDVVNLQLLGFKIIGAIACLFVALVGILLIIATWLVKQIKSS